VDKLTPWIKSELNLKRREIAEDFDRDVGDIITRDPEALRDYILSKQFYDEGRFVQSNEFLEEAVKIDPEFALAYKRISENYHYLGDFDQSERFAQKALDLAERASVRDRYLIRGWAFTILEDSYDKAIVNYEEMLKQYPNDEDGNTYIGAIYRNMEEWDLAAGYFEKIIDLDPIIACGNLSLIYSAEGKYEKARSLLIANEEKYENPSLFHWEMSVHYLSQGKLDRALAEIEEAYSLDPSLDINLEVMGNIHQCRNEFREAALFYSRLQERESQDSILEGEYWTALLSIAQGQYRKAASELEQAVRMAEEEGLDASLSDPLEKLAYLEMQRRDFKKALDVLNKVLSVAEKIKSVADITLAQYFSGIVDVRRGDIAGAKVRAEELKQTIDRTGVRKHQRYYYHLMGMIAAGEGLWAEAASQYEKSLTLLNHQYEVYDVHAFFLYPYALVSYESGELDKAQGLFERITRLTTGRLQWGDLYALSHYWLGKIYQKKGLAGRALESYEDFLSLWKNADKGFVEVGDAAEELSKLKKIS
jgi:tetratricopeptide (TPR) repeat protein